jgi:D-3-phosphoglycerate dehydrogenase
MKAVITAQFDNAVLMQLREQMGVEHVGWGVTGEVLRPQELLSFVQDAEILVVEIEACDAYIIRHSPKLAFVGSCRNNPVNVDLDAATQRGIPVVFTPGRNADAVAEMTLALMIMVARQMGRALRDVWRGKWTAAEEFSYLKYKGFELGGKTAGIIGLGAIGRRVKHLCEAFGMQTLVHDPYLENGSTVQATVHFVDMATLLRQADFVTLHCPDTPETKGLIGPEELRLMKPKAYLINTARGKHVDEDALREAVKNEVIAGAALDVYQAEPLPLDHPFHELENIILMPHIGGATFDVIRNHSLMIYEEIQRHLRGETLQYLRNPKIQ